MCGWMDFPGDRNDGWTRLCMFLFFSQGPSGCALIAATSGSCMVKRGIALKWD